MENLEKKKIEPALNKNMEIIFEPFYITKQEDDERIKRLAKKILASIERARKAKRTGKAAKDDVDGIFRQDTEKILGIEESG